MKNVFDELKWRGLLYDATEGMEDILLKEKVTIYTGFDPTGDSLHVGSLVPIMGLARLQRFGHTPIALAGGGTGMIGDPSGKAHERQLLTKAQVDSNVEAIKKQLSRFLDFDKPENPAKLLNNGDWLLSMSLMDFLRDVGKHFTINYMIAKESVKSRIEREDGISYTEFSYMLLQGFDFLHLFDKHNCTVQAGGSDQWGNIVTGMELVRRMRGKKTHGIVFPLITKADGSKFGKTESGTIWLDANKTSPYRFYQFWLNTGDADVIKYLKYFTWLTQEEISELEKALAENPEQRTAQRALAEAMTRIVHGEAALEKALSASKVLFGGDLAGLSADDISDIFADVPSSEINKNEISAEGYSYVDLVAESALAKSKGEARRAIQGNGIAINNIKVTDIDHKICLDDSIDEQFIVLRKGKKNFHLIKIV
ncbi:MAG TPA: tyrosine--tRNA ligase [Gammaproteobacteria bacterium]|nr:tyrosine--tRNA ligase [Gammaproteobacteria bacterium]